MGGEQSPGNGEDYDRLARDAIDAQTGQEQMGLAEERRARIERVKGSLERHYDARRKYTDKQREEGNE